MRNYTCDICRCGLPYGRLRYVAKIDVYAAYDTLEIRREDLERDTDYELRELFAKMKDVDPEQLLKEVYANFKFDLCHKCHKEYIRDPLFGFSGESSQEA